MVTAVSALPAGASCLFVFASVPPCFARQVLVCFQVWGTPEEGPGDPRTGEYLGGVGRGGNQRTLRQMRNCHQPARELPLNVVTGNAPMNVPALLYSAQEYHLLHFAMFHIVLPGRFLFVSRSGGAPEEGPGDPRTGEC